MKGREFEFDLELEAKGELNLTLAEERAARLGGRQEVRVEDQRRAARAADRRVNVRYLSAVEDVEALDQSLKVHRLFQAEATRDSQVCVDDARHLEGVA